MATHVYYNSSLHVTSAGAPCASQYMFRLCAEQQSTCYFKRASSSVPTRACQKAAWIALRYSSWAEIRQQAGHLLEPFRNNPAVTDHRVGLNSTAISAALEAVDDRCREAALFASLWKTAEAVPNPLIVTLRWFGNDNAAWRGLAAVDDIPAGSLLLSVPWNHVLAVPLNLSNLSPTNGGVPAGTRIPFCDIPEGPNDAELKQLAEASRGKDWRLGGDSRVVCQLAAKLVEAIRIQGSFWNQYLALLPRSVESPAWWTADQLAELQSPVAELAALAHREHLEGLASAAADLIGGGVPDGSGANQDEALWAVQMVLSRSFVVERDGVPMQVLVPFADMLNHRQPEARPRKAAERQVAPWRWTQSPERPAGERFEIRSETRLAPAVAAEDADVDASEATISYGPRPSLEFLLSFGFVPAGTTSDRVALYPDMQALVDDLAEKVPLLRAKEEVLVSLGGPYALWLHSGGTAPLALHYAMILHAASRDEISALEAALTSQGRGGYAPVSASTRQAAARQLAERCREILEGFPTTLEQDEALLSAAALKKSPAMKVEEREKARQKGVLTPQHRLAIEYRLATKRTLREGLTRFALLAEAS